MIYYTYMVLVWGPRAIEDEWTAVMLIIFNVVFGMLLWSYWAASLGDPGAVPKNWGYDFNS